MNGTFFGFFSFSRRERAGVLLLLALCLLGWLAPSFFDRWAPRRPVDFSSFQRQVAALERAAEEASHPTALAVAAPAAFLFDPNRADSAQLRQLGLPPRVVRNILRYRATGGRFRRASDLSRIYDLSPADYERLAPFIRIESGVTHRRPPAEGDERAPLRLFPFNPNSVTTDELRALGLPGRVARTLVNFREKGGSFRSAADLGKVYGISPDDVRRLTPYVRLEKAEPSAPSPAPAPPERPPLDINQADAAAWQSLHGIGPVLSARIVRFRDKLGGFADVDQVGETYGLPDSTFIRIRDQLRASPLPRPLAVNQLGEDSLSAHPYLNRRQARAIVRYREQHGPFHSPEDLEKVGALPAKTRRRLAPYWSFRQAAQ